MMCRLLDVSKSGFYAWIKRKPSQRSRQNTRLTELIKQVHFNSHGVYGAPKIYHELKVKGMNVGKNRIAKLMKLSGLKGLPRRRFKRLPNEEYRFPYAPNLLNQQFVVSKPNNVWGADITYIHTRQGILYLAVVMDLYSRKIVGWAMDKNMSRFLAIEALSMALNLRKPSQGLIHHSDRGGQYASDDYRNLLEKHGIVCSMSARGNCYDNAVIESFFGCLKRERIRRYRYVTLQEAKQDIFNYIECFYNRERRHGHLGFVSPVEFEARTLCLN